MVALQSLARARKGCAARPGPAVASELIQITEGETPIGNVYLDDLERVLKCDAGIPRDVVFRALVLYTRNGRLSGETASRENGRIYGWDVVDEDEW